MENIAFIIPFIVGLILFIFYNKETVWWEYLLLLFPTILIFFILRFTMISYRESDTEYLGYYAISTNYYEPWNEYIHKTCSRTTTVGKTTVTTYYDCSYVDYHSAHWTITLNDKSEINISEELYNKLINKWNTGQIFYDMHRDYHTQDGDMYYMLWNNDSDDALNITRDGSYVNKVKCSESIFNFEDIEQSEVDKYKLFDYPEVSDYEQNTIISKHKIDDNLLQRWNFMNAYYGMSNKFRCYLYFTYNQPSEFVNKQMSYWKGVNQNEICIFINLDSTTLKKNWVQVKSWSDKPELEIMIRDNIASNDSVKIDEIINLIENNLDKWNKKDFHDFDYLTIELIDTQITIIILILLIYNIGISIWIISNQYNKNNI